MREISAHKAGYYTGGAESEEHIVHRAVDFQGTFQSVQEFRRLRQKTVQQKGKIGRGKYKYKGRRKNSGRQKSSRKTRKDRRVRKETSHSRHAKTREKKGATDGIHFPNGRSCGEPAGTSLPHKAAQARKQPAEKVQNPTEQKPLPPLRARRMRTYNLQREMKRCPEQAIPHPPKAKETKPPQTKAERSVSRRRTCRSRKKAGKTHKKARARHSLPANRPIRMP